MRFHVLKAATAAQFGTLLDYNEATPSNPL